MLTIRPNSNELRDLIEQYGSQKVMKTAITMARVIREDEANECFVSPQRSGDDEKPGYVLTREGPAAFRPGYYLCAGAESELWPMTPEEFLKLKIRHPEYQQDDENGWGAYINQKPAMAIQLDMEFQVEIWDGSLITAQPGDLLLYSPDLSSTWAVGPTIFQKTYIFA